MNSFFAFNADMQVYRVDEEGETGQNCPRGTPRILGTQYAIRGGVEVVSFNPEDCSTRHIGDSLEA